MIRILIRAGVVSATVALVASAHALPIENHVTRAAEAPRAVDVRTLPAESAPTWITDALLGSFDRSAGAVGWATAPADANRILSAKPSQNPAFPAAFVFQSHSAMFLAVEIPSRDSHRPPIGG